MKSRVFVVLTSLLFVVVSAPAVELFRYRYRAEDGREFECVFETVEQSVPKTVGEEGGRNCDGLDEGFLPRAGRHNESQEFRTRPIPHWLFCFSETIEGPIQRMYFVVLLPNGMVVEPKFAERL